LASAGIASYRACGLSVCDFDGSAAIPGLEHRETWGTRANPEYDALYRKVHTTQGRWISPDPAGLAAVGLTDPQTWNRYAYVGNNPLSAVDPLGLDDVKCCGGDFYSQQLAAWNRNPDFSFGSLVDSNNHETFGEKYYDLPGYNNSLASGVEGYLRSIPGYSVQGGNLYRWVPGGGPLGQECNPTCYTSTGYWRLAGTAAGGSVMRAYKWTKWLDHVFEQYYEGKRLKDEMEADRAVRDLAFDPTVIAKHPQFAEIYLLEDQNLWLDVGRQTGKIMGDVPNIPGEGRFGDAVFDAYGQMRDANNQRIDELLQEIGSGR